MSLPSCNSPTDDVTPPDRGRRSDLRVTIVFILFQLSILAWYGSRAVVQTTDKAPAAQPSASALLGRQPARFSFPGLTQAAARFRAGILQQRIELVLRDNFPLWDQLIPRYQTMARGLSGSTLNLFPDRWTPLLPVGGTGIVTTRAWDRLYDLPKVRRTTDFAALQTQAEYYNTLLHNCPQIHLYVFCAHRAIDLLAERGLYPDSVTEHLSTDSDVATFQRLLDSRIEFAWSGKDRPPGDAIADYFLTDHHWNMQGAYQVYLALHRMFLRHHPAAGGPLSPTAWFRPLRAAFRGSRCRNAGAYDGLADDLVDAHFPIPAFSAVKVCGRTDVPRDRKAAYGQGVVSTDKFADHYTAYFGENYGLVTYAAPAESQAAAGNLLVIGDSFDNCIEPLLAAPFANSYFVDLRYYSLHVGQPFDLHAFLLEHAISDLVFLGGSEWILGFEPLSPN